MAGVTSGPLPPRAILIRSASADIAPWAQQEPQYWGMCWLREIVQKFWPSLSHQLKDEGISAGAVRRSCELEPEELPRQTTPSFSVSSRLRSSLRRLDVPPHVKAPGGSDLASSFVKQPLGTAADLHHVHLVSLLHFDSSFTGSQGSSARAGVQAHRATSARAAFMMHRRASGKKGRES